MAARQQAALLRKWQPQDAERFDLAALSAISSLNFRHETDMPVPATGYRTIEHSVQGESWHIAINTDIEEPVQRFMTLHILKHIIDDPVADSLYEGTRATTAAVRDAMADRFADEVLAPEELIESAECMALSPGELAARFKAPLDTIQRQLAAARLDTSEPVTDPTPGGLLTVTEVCSRLRISRWTVYELIKSKALRPIHIRTRTLFAAEELERYLSTLQDAGGHHG
ncbi:helix-turn-helix domain-containing protein [Sinomonas cellulolyticus]|uniref:Excisionase family DNA-binding protein n=1 Tax=Sinomonas cellulolyticus TaxID=2801916 RepID=A0ABS1K4A8_9MICC|nr:MULTISPECIES: helix-turn-helix domain-containing protein [Sinomonas]MBL0706303.1 excisionase family DNA-binding protein [Sinomonas cellulolyticus]